MRVEYCPAAVIDAPSERVWSLLANPAAMEEWVDADFVAADPPGEVAPGQHLRLRARGLGRWWPVAMDVGEVVPGERLGLEVRLPFGIVNDEMITLADTGQGGTLVRFN